MKNERARSKEMRDKATARSLGGGDGQVSKNEQEALYSRKDTMSPKQKVLSRSMELINQGISKHMAVAIAMDEHLDRNIDKDTKLDKDQK